MLNALKRRIARNMAQRNYVRTLVREDLVRDGDFIDAVAEGYLRDPGKLGHLLHHEAFFAAVLERLSDNPEAMHQMMQGPRLRRRMRAQKDLLRFIANDPELLAAILRQVTKDRRAGALQALLRGRAETLEELADGPEAMAGLMAQAMVSAGETEAEGENEAVADAKHAMRALAHYAGSNSAAFLAALSENDPKFVTGMLAQPAIREQVSVAVAADRDALAEVLELAAIQLREGKTPSERMQLVLETLASVPAFRTAMQRDPQMRDALAALARDSAESAGMAAPRELAGAD